MSRLCGLTGKSVLYGNKVSHANNKTKRKFLPNLQNVSFLSDVLGMSIRVRLSTNAIRTIEKNGGIDDYLMSASSDVLSIKFKRLKKLIGSKKSN